MKDIEIIRTPIVTPSRKLTARWTVDEITSLTKFRLIESSGEGIPTGYCLVRVNGQVAAWIEKQAIHLWKPSDDVITSDYDYCIANELHTIMTLKWS
jgi:hypothetical protein